MGFKALEQGQEVEFTLVQGEKGVEAKVRNQSGAYSLRFGITRMSFQERLIVVHRM